MHLKILFMVGFVLISSLSGTAQNIFAYDLSNPDRSIILPKVLNEISGITDVDMHHVACVQDEIGTVFLVELKTGKITGTHFFEATGDYEGITITQDRVMFILRSDGLLTEWQDFPENKASISSHELPIQTRDNEGLCYDADNHRLLIAAKSKPEDKSQKDFRFIYAFDLKSKTMANKPAYSLDIRDLEKFASNMGLLPLNSTKKGKEAKFDFRPSSLAIHPASNELYIISDADKLLITLDAEMNIKRMIRLNPDIFTKPEGLTFLSDNTMLISNEAQDGIPNILIFAAQD